jgi:hypothetical protein
MKLGPTDWLVWVAAPLFVFAAVPVACVCEVLCFDCELAVEPAFELPDERVADPLPADFAVLLPVSFADPVFELDDVPVVDPLLELLPVLEEALVLGVAGFGVGRAMGVGRMELSPTCGLSSRPDAL